MSLQVVVNTNKKMLVLMIAVVVCSLAAPCSAQKNYKESEHQSKTTAMSAADPNFTFKKTSGFSDKELVYKFIFSVLLVVGVGIVAIYFSKRLGGKIPRLSGKKVQIVETLYLGQRKALHLLKIGRREILVGSTNENINFIADVTETFSDLTGFVDDSQTETNES